MVRREFVDYLHDILDAAEKAESFTSGMDLGTFRADDKTVFAVVRALEIIGEATKHVPRSVRERYRDVPWRSMAGIRDKLIHGYFGVDREVVWKTVQEDVPALKPMIARVLAEVDTTGPPG